MSVDSVAVKLPTFWAAQPKVWFAQTKVQFNLRKITTDKTMYFHVVAALDQETASDKANQPYKQRSGIGQVQGHKRATDKDF